MEDFKSKIGEELYNQIVTKIGDKEIFLHDKGTKAGVIAVADGDKMVATFIPKSEFDNVNREKISLNEQITALTGNLETLKKENKGNAEILESLAKKKQEYDELVEKHKSELTEVKKQASKDKFFADKGIKDPVAQKALKFLFEDAEFDIEKNEFKGVNENFESLAKNPSFASVIGTTQIVGDDHVEGNQQTNIVLSASDKAKADSMNLDNDSYLELKQKYPDMLK